MLVRLLIAVSLVAAAPAARAEPRLLEETLRLDLVVPSAAPATAPDLHALAVVAELSAAQPATDFDLLGEPEKPPPPSADARRMRLRRTMLGLHQGVGLGLLALQLTTTTVGQLNYNDKFHGGNTNRWKQSHELLAWTNVGAFAVNGAIAIFAPSAPGGSSSGFDRVTLHKVSMFTAAAGMAAQGALGVYTVRREGFQNQERMGTAHLAIGYATLAAMLVGVSAIVF